MARHLLLDSFIGICFPLRPSDAATFWQLYDFDCVVSHTAMNVWLLPYF